MITYDLNTIKNVFQLIRQNVVQKEHYLKNVHVQEVKRQLNGEKSQKLVNLIGNNIVYFVVKFVQ